MKQAMSTQMEQMEAEVFKELEACESLSTELAARRQAKDASKVRVEQLEALALKERQLCKVLSKRLASQRYALAVSNMRVKEQAESPDDYFVDFAQRKAREALLADFIQLRKTFDASSARMEQVKAEALKELREDCIKVAAIPTATEESASPSTASRRQLEIIAEKTLLESRDRLIRASKKTSLDAACCMVPMHRLIKLHND
eukprot:gnl/TRDRNA2_/TRDRNA2_135622_c1_seq4.p1 gnl/TRDRNA2_/TRDRNA2_135622_c1~~gnl/TRDRNA2_/TRDRNA2_135622_c1_seq4.p1  ORF type:complete len:202 (+),score=46.33 gnl/TRDRNA2_/TRDRNA2_135622_c1_seq4:404-1009(+)